MTSSEIQTLITETRTKLKNPNWYSTFAQTYELLEAFENVSKERDSLLKSRAEHCAAVELYADRALQAEQKNLNLQELAQKIANQHSNHCVLGCEWEPETIKQATELGVELE